MYEKTRDLARVFLHHIENLFFIKYIKKNYVVYVLPYMNSNGNKNLKFHLSCPCYDNLKQDKTDTVNTYVRTFFNLKLVFLLASESE